MFYLFIFLLCQVNYEIIFLIFLFPFILSNFFYILIFILASNIQELIESVENLRHEDVNVRAEAFSHLSEIGKIYLSIKFFFAIFNIFLTLF